MILSVCDNPDVLKVVNLIKTIILIIKIAVPIILIISVMVDYMNAIKDNDELAKTSRLATRKLAAAILVFLIPTFVNIIADVIIPNSEYTACLDNANSRGIKIAYETIASDLMDKARTSRDINSVNEALKYVYKLEDESLRNKYLEELNKIKKEIEDKNKEEYDKTHTGTSSDFVGVAKKVWEEIVLGKRKFTYHQGNNIPITTSYCDCSSYVSWVIYEYGYEDFKGYQRNTHGLYTTNYKQKYGWEEVYYPAGTDLSSIVRPGDIIVRVSVDKNGNAGYGHTDIVAKTEGGILAYDCGSSWRVENGKYPNGTEISSFLKDNRPAKIIRVTKPN